MKQIVKDVLDFLQTQKHPVPISTIQKACSLNWQSITDAVAIIEMAQECWFMDIIEGIRGKEYILKEPWSAAINMDHVLRAKIVEVIENHPIPKEG